MIIFDLDGTLANCEHRRHFVDPSKNACLCGYSEENSHLPRSSILCPRHDFKPNWNAFYEECDKDEPIYESIEVFKSLNENEIHIWSGRCESEIEKTKLWLWKYCGCGFDPDLTYPQVIKMRPIGDCTPDDQLKERWLDEHIASGGKPIEMVFDSDRDSIVMWRRRGIFVFNCCQHDEEF